VRLRFEPALVRVNAAIEPATRTVEGVTRVPRDTTTGRVLESMVLPALEHGGYEYHQQEVVGTRLGGGRHKVDVLAWSPTKAFLVSLKWQQVSGTAEQKVPFEAICLADAVLASEGRLTKAYIVLGGPGWKLRKFFTEGGLRDHLVHADLVEILDLETFIGRANKGQL